MFRSGTHSFGVGAFFIAGRRVEVEKKYHEKQTELIMLMANSLNLVSKFTEFTDQFH